MLGREVVIKFFVRLAGIVVGIAVDIYLSRFAECISIFYSGIMVLVIVIDVLGTGF
jgi:hypothetical protein